MTDKKSQVALAHTEDRAYGVAASIQALEINPVKGKAVLVKPNFNTADAAPGSTHNDTLVALVEEIWKMGAGSVSLGERSFPPTREVMEQKGVLPLMKALDVEVLNFDDLPPGDWVPVHPEGSRWPGGFRVARPVLEAECLVSTGCIKTHQYGGVITMSLKLHVGVLPTYRNGSDLMSTLHGSPHMQELIADLNLPFKPALVVLDGVDAFTDGGPMDGKRARGDVLLASSDRVAIDAVGVAILKDLGSNPAIMRPKIYEQVQIARAAAMGLGATSPDEIDLIPADASSREYRDRILGILKEG
ncbi:MAG: DUF362 domain-containing protein [Desulfobacterales bacterium]|nr:DUF362 domain-containing protein [Desulfobacterales bacterium]